MSGLVAAVDVGTGSARAGVFDLAGRALGVAESPIALHRPAPGHAEQDSTRIWRAVGQAMRDARAAAGVGAADIAGLAFDATCSLVLRGGDGAPLAVSPGAEGECRDTIAWLDHRARAQAAACTATGHRMLETLGGAMSPEMQTPKLMWLKRNAPDLWARLGLAFDLSDYLGWRATGATARSRCTLTCKWGYLGHETPGWPDDFHAAIGLEDLRARTGLPDRAAPVGSPLGALTPAAAADLGLGAGTPVAVGLIDAHAGALAVLGAFAGRPGALAGQAALIAGTSSCMMSFSPEPQPAPGLWGPHLGVGFEGMWMREGGQTASGGLLDHVCLLWTGQPATPALHDRICARIAELRAAEGWGLAAHLHVLPDFQGNRTPFGDASALGAVSGLDMDRSFDGLCRIYWRTAVALGLGLRQIVGHMGRHGHAVEALHLAGGHARSPLLAALYASTTGRPVHCPQTPNAMLLGGAMVAATGAGLFSGLDAAAKAMARPARTFRPDPEAEPWMARDYRILLEMQTQRARLREMSAPPPAPEGDPG